MQYQAPAFKTLLQQGHVQTIVVSSRSGDSCPEKWLTREAKYIVDVALRASYPHVGMTYSTCCGSKRWHLQEIKELCSQPYSTTMNSDPSGRICFLFLCWSPPLTMTLWVLSDRGSLSRDPILWQYLGLPRSQPLLHLALFGCSFSTYVCRVPGDECSLASVNHGKSILITRDWFKNRLT